jgi:hypothetical protein
MRCRAIEGPKGVTDAPPHVEEIGFYIPEAPPKNPSGTIQINHAIVDEKGLIYANDRFTGGLYILRYTGSVPFDQRRSRVNARHFPWFCRRRDGQRETSCSANRSTARETAAPGNGYNKRRSVTCAGLGPARAVSRLTRATRRSHGSLPQHVSHCPAR